MDETRERGRPHPTERFAGPEHVYDLAAACEHLRAEATPARQGHRQSTLLKHSTGTMSVFCFDAKAGLAEHEAKGYVTIQVLRGHLQVKTGTQTHELSAGQVLVMSPGVRHALLAIDAVDLLLIVNLV
jgi:quercetin dioxygenase-like cupin family protein